MCILPLYEIEVAEVNNMLPFINLLRVQKWKVTGALILSAQFAVFRNVCLIQKKHGLFILSSLKPRKKIKSYLKRILFDRS